MGAAGGFGEVLASGRLLARGEWLVLVLNLGLYM